jgi:hypothetical protein
MAGVQTMPFTFITPFGSAIASTVAGKLKIPVVYIVSLSGVLQTLEFGLLASLPTSGDIPTRIYGFQVIAGFGCGINISAQRLYSCWCHSWLKLAIKVSPGDLRLPQCEVLTMIAVGMGAMSQLRVMGGAIVLAIATSVFNSSTSPRLMEYLSRYSMTTNAVYSAQSLAILSAIDRGEVRSILALGFNRQMVVLSTFAAAQIPTAAFLWRRKKIVV